MAQIKTGTVNLTNGSNVVVGVGTSWLGTVQPGWIFVSVDGLPYFVAGAPSDNTHLTLTAPYAGASASGMPYGIVTGYSPILSLPLIGINDMDAATMISRALCMLEQAISAAQNGVVFKGSWNAATNSPTIPAAASGNANWEYVVSVAGSTTINGISSWSIGDMIRSNGSAWSRIPAPTGATSIAQLTDWPSGVSATDLSMIGNVTSDVQAQINGKLAATLQALTTMVLAAAPRRIEGVWGDSTDGGTTPDATTQASINALLNAGVPAANIRWFYTPGVVSNSLVIAGAASASAADNITLVLAGGTLAIDAATSASLSDNVVITSASGGTLTISNATSASTSDNVVIILAGGTFAIDNATSASSADNVVITSAGGGTLAINNVVSASTADNVVMSQPSALALDTAYGNLAYTGDSSTAKSITGVNTTSGSNEVVILMATMEVDSGYHVAANGSASGGGLTWTRQASACSYQTNENGSIGRVEVFTAVGQLSNATLTYTPGSVGGPGAIWVVTVKGSASNTIGKTAVDYVSGDAGTGIMQSSFTPLATGSLVLGVFENFWNATAPTMPSGQQLISMTSGANEYSTADGGSCFIMQKTALTPNTSAFTFGPSAPLAGGQWGMIEVKP